MRVKWINGLVDANGRYRPHLPPVDTTLYWANPPGGARQRDTRPTFADTPGRYTGPVPIVTHVHGAVGVGDESDGYAEAWYLPAANIPAGYAREGTRAAQVNLTATNGNRLLMGLAERADVIVDFTNVPVVDYLLGNVGPDEPFGGGEPTGDFDAADPDTTGQVMQFRVGPAVNPDPTTPPQVLHLPAIVPLPAATVTRPLALIEKAGIGKDADGHDVEGPVEAPRTRSSPTQVRSRASRRSSTAAASSSGTATSWSTKTTR